MNIDLDEIRPDRFVIGNEKVRPLLRGEGIANGKFFELVTWRRDGLMARIRARGFNVRTIADRIDALPPLHMVLPPGDLGVRALSAKERIATFDPDALHWHDVAPTDVNGKPAVWLRAGQALRRRRSRGAGDYYIATLANGQINLLAVGENTALLHAYAQLAEQQPVTLRFTQTDSDVLVPAQQALLPTPHREIIELLCLEKAPPWTIPLSAWALADAVFERLAIRFAPAAAARS